MIVLSHLKLQQLQLTAAWTRTLFDSSEYAGLVRPCWLGSMCARFFRLPDAARAFHLVFKQACDSADTGGGEPAPLSAGPLNADGSSWIYVPEAMLPANAAPEPASLPPLDASMLKSPLPAVESDPSAQAGVEAAVPPLPLELITSLRRFPFAPLYVMRRLRLFFRNVLRNFTCMCMCLHVPVLQHRHLSLGCVLWKSMFRCQLLWHLPRRMLPFALSQVAISSWHWFCDRWRRIHCEPAVGAHHFAVRCAAAFLQPNPAFLPRRPTFMQVAWF